MAPPAECASVCVVLIIKQCFSIKKAFCIANEDWRTHRLTHSRLRLLCAALGFFLWPPLHF